MKDNMKRLLAAVLSMVLSASGGGTAIAQTIKLRIEAAPQVRLVPLASLPVGVQQALPNLIPSNAALGASIIPAPAAAVPAESAKPALALPALQAAAAVFKALPEALKTAESGSYEGRVALDGARAGLRGDGDEISGAEGAGTRLPPASAGPELDRKAVVPAAIAGPSREAVSPASAALRSIGGSLKRFARGAALLAGMALAACGGGGHSAPPAPTLFPITPAQITADVAAAQVMNAALPQVLTGPVGAPEADVAYRLDVPAPQKVNVALDGAPGVKFHLLLVDSAGNIAAEDDNTAVAGAPAHFTLDVPAESRTIIIHNNTRGAGDYTLYVSRITEASLAQLQADAAGAVPVAQALPTTLTNLLGDSAHDAAYRLDLAQAGKLALNVPGIKGADLDLVLLDASGVPVVRASNVTAPGASASVESDVPAGRFYAVLHNNNDGAVGDEFRLTISQLVPITGVQIQQDVANAAPLDISRTGTANGTLSTSQNDASYRLTAAQDGTIGATVSGVPGTIVNVLLVDGSGAVLQSVENAASPGTELKISRAVAAGTYYLIVHNVNNGSGSYTVYAAETVAITAAQISGDIARASTLAGPPVTAGGNLGTSQNDASYKFTVARPQTVAVSVPGVAGAALDVLLVDSAGNILGRADNSNDPGAASSFNAALQSGSYYLIIHNANSAQGSYGLTVTPILVPITNAQIQSDIAGALPAGAMPASQSGPLGSYTNDATYRVSLPQAGTIRAHVDKISGATFDLLIVDAWGSVVGRDNNTGGSSRAADVSAGASAGTYFVIVHNNNGGAVGATYHLGIAESIPVTSSQISSDMSHASDATVWSSRSGSIGDSAHDAAYRIVADADGTVSISVDGIYGVELDLLLVDDWGDVVGRDDGTGYPGWSGYISKTLVPGRAYYVILHNVNNASIGGSYSLRMNYSYATVYGSFSGFLDDATWGDDYSVTFLRAGALDVGVNGISDKWIGLSLYDAYGHLVAYDESSDYGGGASFNGINVPAGDYTIRVEDLGGDGVGSYWVSYTLR